VFKESPETDPPLFEEVFLNRTPKRNLGGKMEIRSKSDSQIDLAELIADLYARWTLDCLVEIAHAVSIDYFSYPEFYKGDDTPDSIEDLWASYGSVKNFANKDQRTVLAGAILGGCDGYSPKGNAYNDEFHQQRDALFKACIAAQTATSAQSRDGLNANVTFVLPDFQKYLGRFTGKAVRLAHDQIKAVTETAFSILRSDTVSARFIGIQSPISEDWPLETADSNGDSLVEECIAQLKVAGVEMPSGFTNVRTLAQAGSDALTAILQPTTNLDDLIRKTYSWATFTGSYQPYTGKQ
jgi:hypothetical protein